MKKAVYKRFRILAQMVEGGAWHVYGRFANPMERDRVLARDLRRASVNWMNLVKDDLPLEAAPATEVKVKAAKKAGPKKAQASPTPSDIVEKHKDHWN